MIRRLLIATALIMLASGARAFWQSRDSNYNVVVNGGSSSPPLGPTPEWDPISNMSIAPGVPGLGIPSVNVGGFPAIVSSAIWNN